MEDRCHFGFFAHAGAFTARFVVARQFMFVRLDHQTIFLGRLFLKLTVLFWERRFPDRGELGRPSTEPANRGSAFCHAVAIPHISHSRVRSSVSSPLSWELAIGRRQCYVQFCSKSGQFIRVFTCVEIIC